MKTAVKLARFVELELQYEGYDVTVCHDGREGMNQIMDNLFDMILLDLMLPGLGTAVHILFSSAPPLCRPPLPYAFPYQSSNPAPAKEIFSRVYWKTNM